MLRKLTLAAICLAMMIVSSGVFAQPSAPKAAIVRIIPGDANKIPGTGFIVKVDEHAAYILTASHVVEGGAPKVEFFTKRNSLVSARIAEGAEWGDSKGLVLLIVDAPLPTGLTTLPIDTDSKLEGGETISVIGHPASGGSWAIARGDVASRQGRILYFSAPIDRGNSGGPLLLDGAVVGIVTNKGPTFGEAVEALSIMAFLRGSDINRTPSSNTSKATPVPNEAPAAVPSHRPAATNPISAMRAGQVFKDCEGCPEMVVVPPGDFLMGSPENEESRVANESPQHRVKIAHPLAVGQSEVTRGQFARFVAETKHSAEDGCYVWDATKSAVAARAELSWKNPGFSQSDDHPVVCVNWNDAKAYARWLSKKTGRSYRLLSEAEWEYVARAGQTTAYFWGEPFAPKGCKHANVADAKAKNVLALNDRPAECDDGQPYTTAARAYAANRFGVHDMIGNVWEWTEDCWNESYRDAPEGGEVWSKGDCGLRVLRGGSWLYSPALARAAVRNRDYPYKRDYDNGFRLARTDETRASQYSPSSQPHLAVDRALARLVGGFEFNDLLKKQGWETGVWFSPDGKALLSQDSNGTLRLWDIAKRSAIREPAALDELRGRDPLFSNKNELVYLSNTSKQEQITILNLKSAERRTIDIQPVVRDPSTLALSLDGTMLAVGGYPASLWDFRSGKLIGKVPSVRDEDGHEQLARIVGFGPPEEKWLATEVAGRARVQFWQVPTLQAVSGEVKAGTEVALSPDRKLLVGEYWSDVLLWDVKSRKPKAKFEYPLPAGITNLAFTPNGKVLTIVSSQRYGAISFWNVQTQTMLGQIEWHGDKSSVAFSPDGKLMALAAGNLTLWEILF